MRDSGILMAKAMTKAQTFLDFLLYNEPSMMHACQLFNDRIMGLSQRQLDAFHATHGHENDPGQGLGFGACITWRSPGTPMIHFIDARDDGRRDKYCWWLSALLPNPTIVTNQEFLSALIPKAALDEDDQTRTLAKLIDICHLDDVNADFVQSYDNFAARLWDFHKDLTSYMEYAENSDLEPEHLVYLVPHLVACWPGFAPEFKRPPRKIKGLNPPSTAIRDGARIIASHAQAVAKWQETRR